MLSARVKLRRNARAPCNVSLNRHHERGHGPNRKVLAKGFAVVCCGGAKPFNHELTMYRVLADIVNPNVLESIYILDKGIVILNSQVTFGNHRIVYLSPWRNRKSQPPAITASHSDLSTKQLAFDLIPIVRYAFSLCKSRCH